MTDEEGLKKLRCIPIKTFQITFAKYLRVHLGSLLNFWNMGSFQK